mmetsp:Transcript_4353/g.7684  ORF Transcript_4353/g.7684 Transcript_4353/m.7684 type:complete len:119 (+) Transcript_4353:580-936(+)
MSWRQEECSSTIAFLDFLHHRYSLDLCYLLTCCGKCTLQRPYHVWPHQQTKLEGLSCCPESLSQLLQQPKATQEPWMEAAPEVHLERTVQEMPVLGKQVRQAKLGLPCCELNCSTDDS